MTPPKVFIADSISQRGIDELTRDGALEAKVQTGLSETDLAAAIPDFAALIVRSQTKVTAKILNAARKLRVVGRAGVRSRLECVLLHLIRTCRRRARAASKSSWWKISTNCSLSLILFRCIRRL